MLWPANPSRESAAHVRETEVVTGPVATQTVHAIVTGSRLFPLARVLYSASGPVSGRVPVYVAGPCYTRCTDSVKADRLWGTTVEQMPKGGN